MRIAGAPARSRRGRDPGPRPECDGRATTGIPSGRPRPSPRTAGSARATSAASTGRGTVTVRGRLKTMILGASGENIYPEEVEALLNSSPYVAESLVYGDDSGLTALVQLKPEVLQELGARVQDKIEGAEEAAARLGRSVGEAMDTRARASIRRARGRADTGTHQARSQRATRRLLAHRQGADPARTLREDPHAEDQALPVPAKMRAAA